MSISLKQNELVVDFTIGPQVHYEVYPDYRKVHIKFTRPGNQPVDNVVIGQLYLCTNPNGLNRLEYIGEKIIKFTFEEEPLSNALMDVNADGWYKIFTTDETGLLPCLVFAEEPVTLYICLISPLNEVIVSPPLDFV